MALNDGFVDAVKLEMRDMIKREPQLANDPLSMLINKGRTKAYRSTQRFVRRLEFEDIASPVLSEDPLNVDDSSAATLLADILPASPDYTLPQFYSRASHSEAGHIRVAVPRVLQKALGQNSDEAAKTLSKEIMSAAQRRLLAYTIRGLKADVIQNPVLDNAGVGRNKEPFPVANNLLARPRSIEMTANFDAPLTVEAKMWAETYLANLCDVSMHNPTPVDQSINKSNRIYIFSNSGWTAYMTANLGVLANRDFFGDSYYQKGLGRVTTMGGDTYITIPDRYFGRAPTTALAIANANVDLMRFGATPSAAAGNPNLVISGASYQAATAQQNQVSSRDLHSCYILYPDAYEFGETEQYTDLSLEINIDPQRSNEQYIYAIVSRESMRMWDQGAIRLFFGTVGQPVRTGVS